MGIPILLSINLACIQTTRMGRGVSRGYYPENGYRTRINAEKAGFALINRQTGIKNQVCLLGDLFEIQRIRFDLRSSDLISVPVLYLQVYSRGPRKLRNMAGAFQVHQDLSGIVTWKPSATPG